MGDRRGGFIFHTHRLIFMGWVFCLPATNNLGGYTCFSQIGMDLSHHVRVRKGNPNHEPLQVREPFFQPENYQAGLTAAGGGVDLFPYSQASGVAAIELFGAFQCTLRCRYFPRPLPSPFNRDINGRFAEEIVGGAAGAHFAVIVERREIGHRVNGVMLGAPLGEELPVALSKADALIQPRVHLFSEKAEGALAVGGGRRPVRWKIGVNPFCVPRHLVFLLLFCYVADQIIDVRWLAREIFPGLAAGPRIGLVQMWRSFDGFSDKLLDDILARVAALNGKIRANCRLDVVADAVVKADTTEEPGKTGAKTDKAIFLYLDVVLNSGGVCCFGGALSQFFSTLGNLFFGGHAQINGVNVTFN